ncbi:MAG: alpha/beta fold hydrolase [bacterium]
MTPPLVRLPAKDNIPLNVHSMILNSKSEGVGPKTLVVLHGLMGSMDNWRAVQLALAAHARVVCLDLANHGKSPHIATFTLHSMAMDVCETMDHLGIERAFVMGHSLGGKVAMLMGSEWPERVQGLVIVDIMPGAFAPAHLFVLRACQSLDLGQATSRAQLDAALAENILQPETRSFLLKNVVRDEAGRFSWRVPLDYLIANYKVVSDAVPLALSYEGPVLVVAGGKSLFKVQHHEADMRKHFPTMKFTLFPDAGHLLHIEEPQHFTNVVQKFLET